MNIGLVNLAENIGMSVENILLIAVLFGGLIFYAKDIKLGILINLFLQSGLFIVYYQLGLNYTSPLIIVFIHIILLSFTLYAVNKTVETGGVI